MNISMHIWIWADCTKQAGSSSVAMFKYVPSERVPQKVAEESWWLLGAWSEILRWLAWNSGEERERKHVNPCGRH